MKISELSFILAAALAIPALAIPAAATDEGGAGSSSEQSTSESGYTINESSPATDVGNKAVGDTGGAGTTVGTGAGSGAVMLKEIHGIIDSVDAARRSVTVRDTEGNLVSYRLMSGGAVQVGERNASLATLSNGDPVTVTLSEDDPTAAKAIKVGS